jgi:uncharacterized protein YqgC (DUF456 family)
MAFDQIGNIALLTVTLAVMLVGLAGLIFPILPGLVIIWLAGLVYGILSGFTTPAWIILAAMTVLMLIGSVIDNIIMGASARQQGASWLAIGLALVLGVVGSLLLPPFGGLVAALIGLFGLEFWRLRDWRKALDSTKGMALGCGWSSLVRLLIGLLMIGLWLLWAFAFA